MSELVLDLTRLLPGPLCTKILLSMGFRVLRLLPPSGDLLEQYSPETFAWLQTGKQVETLDLKTAMGTERLRDLAQNASVLVENSLPGKMESFGVGPEQLRSVNPALVYVRIGGYRDHDGAPQPGHDLTYLAGMGLLPMLDPAWRSIPLADLCGAFWAAMAVLQGLRMGGGFYEVYLEEACLTAGWPRLEFLDGGRCCYTLFDASDGKIALAALEPHLWQRFCVAAEQKSWQDKAFSPAKAGNSVYEQMCAFFRSRNTEQWDTWGAQHNLPLRALAPAPKQATGPPWRVESAVGQNRGAANV